MPHVDVVVFHRDPRPTDPPLSALLQSARRQIVVYQAGLFRRVGAARVLIVDEQSAAGGARSSPTSFGEALARVVDSERIHRLVVWGSGSVPRLREADARRLVEVARSPRRRAATNNRYSSDVCAISRALVLSDLPALPNDNALPRWLEERAGFEVQELPGRERLALDVDSPLDLVLLGLVPRLPPALRVVVGQVAAKATNGAGEPAARTPSPPTDDLSADVLLAYGGEVARRIAEVRATASDPRAELLVFGRSSARTLAWLERRLPCRVRLLAEERGLRASSRLATRGGGPRASRPPRATLGRLLDRDGPAALPRIVGELADAAVIDSRVLLADRLGGDERSWPIAEDRYASDLLTPPGIADPWLRELTSSAAGAPIPIMLGGHSLVGPGLPLLLGGGAERRIGRPPAIE